MVDLKYGYVGKILRVDLTSKAISEIKTSKYAPEFIGGRAMGAAIYWEEVAPEITAYDPANRLIFMAGPTVGTLAPSANRVFITAKSPVPYPEDCYFFSSMGGHWGPELKFAGYDGLIVQGKASEPVYLWINDGTTEIRDAVHLWGMISREVQLEIKARHGDMTRSVVIGPAGENLCREAIISCDTAFAAGLGGFGAVMGSKNLKAIAVRGTGGVRVARPAELFQLYDHFARLATCKPGEGRQNPVRYMKYFTRSLRNAPPDSGRYEEDNSAIGEEVALGSVKRKHGGCFACPLSCLMGWQFKDGSIPGGAGNCNETKFCLNVENDYYGGKAVGRALIEAVRLHDDFGLSETQTGFKFEYEWFWNLVKAGILTKENTGLPIDKIGSSEFWNKYLHQIAYREGIGALLAEGEERFFVKLMEMIPEHQRDTVKRIGDHWLVKNGCGYYVHWAGGRLKNALSVVKRAGQVRSHQQTIAHFVSPNAKSCYLSSEDLEKTVKAGAIKYFGTEKILDQYSFEAKIPAAVYLQDYSFVSDSVPYCRWVFPKGYSWYTPDHLGDVSIGSKIFTAVTGIEMTEDQMLKAVGERGWNLERMIMVREGRRRQHDDYNDTVFERHKKWLSKDVFQKAMDEYYQERGWDLKTGIPKRENLERLNLDYLADELEEKYGIAVPR